MKNLPSLFERSSPALGVRSGLRNFLNLQRKMDQMLEDSLNMGTPELSLAAGFEPSCDVEEFPTHYLFSFDIPGIKKENISIELSGDNELTVSGERKIERDQKTATTQQRERYFGAFERTFTLPKAVKAEQIEAQYKDGVLQVVIPKNEAAKPKQIKISEGKLGAWSEKHSS